MPNVYKYTPLKSIYSSLDGSEYHIRKMAIYFNYQEKQSIPLFFTVPISLDQNSTKSIFCADERMNDYGKRKKHCNEAMLSTWSF